jgi:outer membrane receptor protein involved in Fe transport
MEALFVAFLLCAVPAAAAGEMPVFVEEIVVEGEAVGETATVEVVTAEEIRERGARNVAEALELVPGVYIRVGGRGVSYARIRGFRQRELAVLIDGVPVAVPYDGQLDLTSLPVESIERIEVSKGASSLLYGANAMGGVVNIITRRSDGNVEGSVRAQYGTDDNLDLAARHQGSVGSLRYQFVAGYLQHDSYRLSNDYQSQPNQIAGSRANSDREGWSGQASFGWDVGESGRASLSLSHVEREFGVPHHESDPKAKFWRYPDWSRSRVDLVYDREMEHGSLKAKAYYDAYENTLASYDDATYSTQDGKNGWTSRSDDHAWGADLFLRRAFGDGWLFKLGARPRTEVHEEQEDGGEPWNRYEADVAALPVEFEWRPEGRRFTLALGASFDWMEWEECQDGEGSGSESSVSPQVAALFDLSDEVVLRLSASRKTRFPTLKELFDSRSGNPDLDPMRADLFEAGVEWAPRDDTTFSLVLFHNDVDDLIDRERKNDPYLNVDEARFQGVETGVSWRRPGRASVDLSYTYLDADNRTSDGVQYEQYRPKHKIDLIASLTLGRGWDLHLTATHVSSQVTDEEPPGELPSYELVDLRVAKGFAAGWEVYVLGHNLLDELYYESAGYPREGRMVYAGVRYSH